MQSATSGTRWDLLIIFLIGGVPLYLGGFFFLLALYALAEWIVSWA